jgi:hypothetical protein
MPLKLAQKSEAKAKHEVAKPENPAKELGSPGVFAIAAAAIGVACYFNALHGDFVFDDKQAVVRNPDVCSEALFTETLTRVFQNDFWGMPLRSERSHKSYRPLTVLSFHANYVLGGLNTTGFHVVNIMLHGFCCFLLVMWCSTCLKISANASALAGFLYAVHPIHTEAVSSIVGRADLLCGTFLLLSLLMHGCSCHATRGFATRVVLFVASLGSAIAAVLCKETGIAVLPICIIFDLLNTLETAHPQRVLSSLMASKGRADKWLLPRVAFLLGFTMMIMFARYQMNGGSAPAFSPGSNPASESTDYLVRLYTFNYYFARHVSALFFPAVMCCDWSMGSIPLLTSIADTRHLLTAAVHAGLGLCAGTLMFHQEMKRKEMLLAIGMAFSCCVVPLLPASNLFVHVGFAVAERILYIPSIGPCILTAVVVAKQIEGKHVGDTARRSLVGAVMGSLVVLLAARTVQRNFEWGSEAGLFKAGVGVNPSNAKLHWGVANALKTSGDLDGAAASCAAALELDPAYKDVHNGMGVVLSDQGKVHESESHYRIALKLDPQSTEVLCNLGKLLHSTRANEAADAYQKSITLISNTRYVREPLIESR